MHASLEDYKLKGALSAHEQAARERGPSLGKVLGVSVAIMAMLPFALILTLIGLGMCVMAVTEGCSKNTFITHVCDPQPESIVVLHTHCDSWLTDITVHISFTCSAEDMETILASKPYVQTERALGSVNSHNLAWWRATGRSAYTHYEIRREETEEHLWVSGDRTKGLFFFFGR